ncbi:TetR/AcrR family transcriptional regulator [Antrihabitans sp. YC2-6]|uniref:TetR/AcrR family transcriptional regulator n=1 Tax=Antrihabitans sp. YC2-6 TaxID=2799498 RepID=UPI0018F5C0FE|nr:TetR/AcrR family transcriptional regulator [Antrihabitans sp. YC2-6]MBJ8344852.1 TetR/AcrR family transcriptional regulator [Antrihabitans sp. YC2-6]
MKSEPAVAGTKGVPRGEREQQILDVAAAEFASRGFTGASMASIAERAGISKPLIYSYFGSRDQLHLACIRRAGEPLVAAVAAAQTDVPAGARAARTMAAIFAALAEHRFDWAVLYDPTLPSDTISGAAAHDYRKALNGMGAAGATEVLAAEQNTDPDDRSLLTHIWFGTVSAVVRWWQDHPEHTADDMAKRCERIFSALTTR